ncbi:DUF4271 domain-containing protein [Winogradskyella aurantiaca]|uniref:DUF4271 domain-containing protein n=1 Tax=Winogradskyella aurantiaca TaxID=2219558 RepID=UPI000E1DABBE|nr:DUF4271 domain-containing protein [Winogradskyella aurantiaca]
MLRQLVTYEWFTIFLIIGLLCITSAKQLFRLRFNDFVMVFTSSKYLKIYTRDQKFIDTFDGLLFANLVISLSIFIFFGYHSFIEPVVFDFYSFLKVMLAVSLFFLIKIMVERLVGSLFDMEQLMDSYLFQKTTYKNFSGLVILFFNLFLLYSAVDPKILIYSCLVFIVLINIIGFINTYQNNLNAINLNIFYFLLYLCALEIGPYILLFKALKEYNG